MKQLKPLFILILFVLVSCSSDDNTPETNNDLIADFFNNMVDQMEANSINRKIIDWDDFRNQVLNAASNVPNFNQTDDAIRLALQLLGDNHSFIIKPNGTFISGSSLECNTVDITPITVPNTIGYIQVNAFSGNGTEEIAFAEQIQQEIRNQDSADLIGWIVDLRNNTGGNMWPMLAGIGPILGEGTAGFFIDPDNSKQTWSYVNGASILDQTAITTVSNPYELINPNPKVAVLLNNAVASSGEAIAIAFIGRDNTQSFGSATCGVSTANARFSLLDGSNLLLTVSYMADRNSNAYGASIIPDTSTPDENVVQAALEYLIN